MPEFVSYLGFPHDQLLFKVWNEHKIADALIGENSTPYIAVEVKLFSKKHINDKISTSYEATWKTYTKSLTRDFNSKYGLLLSNNFIILLDKFDTYTFDLGKITKKQTYQMHELIANRRKVVRRSKPVSEVPENFPGSYNIFFNVTESELRAYSKMLDFVHLSKSCDEKKRALEGLACFLFGKMPGITCRNQVRTSSSEIDLVLSYRGYSMRTLFDDYGRYALVECKNWEKPVGSHQIRDFIGKLKKTKCNLGVIFSKNGITGANKGEFGLREIQSIFDSDGIVIAVVDLNDLEQVRSGKNFYEMIDDKIFDLIFDR